jgi:hypothetical protein
VVVRFRARAIRLPFLQQMLETAPVSWIRTVIEGQRRRALAGDARAGTWARGQARTAQREFLLEHWWLFALFLLAVLAVAIGCGRLMPNEFMKGLVLGAALVAGPGAVWVIAVQVTGSAPVMMGDQAEQWTAQELRKLSRRDWRLVNHFALASDDIDHVLIGPAAHSRSKRNGAGRPGAPTSAGSASRTPPLRRARTPGACGSGTRSTATKFRLRRLWCSGVEACLGGRKKTRFV